MSTPFYLSCPTYARRSVGGNNTQTSLIATVKPKGGNISDCLDANGVGRSFNF